MIAAFLLAYAAHVWKVFSSSGPQTAYSLSSDTIAYLRMASLPVMSRGFLAGERAFVYALFLKMNGGDLAAAGHVQTLAAIACWSFLALALLRLLTTSLGRVLGVGLVLLCALREEILFWNGVSLSESLSCSLFALWIGSWIMFGHGKHRLWKALPLLTSFLFAFVRDSNAFLVLGAAVVLGCLGALRLLPARQALLSLALVAISLGSLASRAHSTRSIYGFNNVLAGRILTESWRIEEFRRLGMPFSLSKDDVASVAGKCGDEYADAMNAMIRGGRPGARALSRWVNTVPIGTYARFLVAHPGYLLWQPLREEGILKLVFPLAGWVPEKPCGNGPMSSAQPPGYQSAMPAPLDRLLRGEPPGWMLAFWAIVIALSAGGVLANWSFRGRWLLPCVMLVAAYPHLLVVWHGDALDVTRHALLVGVQVHLSFALFAALAFDAQAGLRPGGARRLQLP